MSHPAPTSPRVAVRTRASNSIRFNHLTLSDGLLAKGAPIARSIARHPIGFPLARSDRRVYGSRYTMIRITTPALLSALLLSGLVMLPATGEAAPYCAAPGGLDFDDVTFRGTAADDCYGVVTSPKNPNVGGGAGSWTVNTLEGGLFGGEWDGFVKDEGPAGTTSYAGLNWMLNAPQNMTSGTWTLQVQDPPPASFPITVDILAVLKASDRWAAYLFTAETFTRESLEAGTFEISFLNNGGKIPGLSNMTLYFREATPTQVAEPSTLAMIALGLAGVRLHRRRQQRFA